jgi:hypothetical protein
VIIAFNADVARSIHQTSIEIAAYLPVTYVARGALSAIVTLAIAFIDRFEAVHFATNIVVETRAEKTGPKVHTAFVRLSTLHSV